MKLTTSFAIASFLGTLTALAAPTDVFTPTILSPKLGDVWVVGDQASVIWDTSNAPVNITNRIADIFLWKSNRPSPVVLAGNFDILDGEATFMVPQVIAGHDYAVNLFGDSGDVSPQFTIESPFVPRA